MISRRLFFRALPVVGLVMLGGSGRWVEDQWMVKVRRGGAQLVGTLVTRHTGTGERRVQEFQVEALDGGPLGRVERQIAESMARERLLAWLGRLNGGSAKRSSPSS